MTPDAFLYNTALHKESKMLHYIGRPQELALAAVVRKHRREDAKKIKELRKQINYLTQQF